MKGLIVAMLIDKNSTSTHDVRINIDKGLIYDCQKDLLVCCVQNMIFECFSKIGELWNFKAKHHC